MKKAIPFVAFLFLIGCNNEPAAADAVAKDNAQNKDTMALQLKLNELIAASSKASNRLIDIEDLTEAELQRLKRFYCELGELAEKDKDLFTSHSVEEAKEIQQEKAEFR